MDGNRTTRRDLLRRRPVSPQVRLYADPFRRKLIKSATFPLNFFFNFFDTWRGAF